MHRFRIRPSNDEAATIEIDALDGSAALNILSCGPSCEADVWRDGAYNFSVRKEGGAEANFWAIFRRPELAAGTAAPGEPTAGL